LATTSSFRRRITPNGRRKFIERILKMKAATETIVRKLFTLATK
jgi:hypothetical protein